MKLVVDTTVIIAVITNEKHKDKLIELTKGSELNAPQSLHWEVGNAFSAMFKRNRITYQQSQEISKYSYQRLIMANLTGQRGVQRFSVA
ncbi:MAG: type II toxin-antitoxin system VapC family toxin [bacterium]